MSRPVKETNNPTIKREKNTCIYCGEPTVDIEEYCSISCKKTAKLEKYN